MKELNTVIATLIFAASLVGDAISAINKNADSVSSSMRASGLLLTLTAAAPVIKSKEWGISGDYQSIGWAFLVVLVGVVGLHEGNEDVRLSDAVYVTSVSLVAILILVAGGIDSYGRGDVDKETTGTVIAFAGSTLIYTSSRVVRSGFAHSFEVVDASVTQGNFTTNAYAHASLMATVATVFGGSVGIGAGTVLLTRRESLKQGMHSTEKITTTVGLCSLVSMCLAVFAQASYAEQVDDLAALFSEGACMRFTPECEMSAEGRRFSIANTGAANLFLNSLGMAILAFPSSFAMSSREEFASFRWPTEILFAAFVVFVVFTIGVALHLPYEADTAYMDAIVLTLFSSCFVSFYVDTGFGQFLWTLGMVVEQVALVHQYGVEDVFKYLTHMFLLLIVVLHIVHICLSSIAFCSERLELAIGAITFAGLSLSMFLFLASAALQLSLNGYGMETLNRGNGIHTSLAYAYQHYTPVVVWGSLLSCRCEVGVLKKSVSKTWMAGLWVGTVVISIVIYVVVFLSMGLSSPTANAVEWKAFGVAMVGVVVAPWLAGAGL